MSDKPLASLSDQGLADPMTEPFWQACLQRRLIIQRCSSCGQHQFYPRPYCLGCETGAVEWIDASGKATVYSLTTVRVPVLADLAPPYLLALVDLDEGPRLLTNIVGGEVKIGDRVTLDWRPREGLPPVPVFKPTQAAPQGR